MENTIKKIGAFILDHMEFVVWREGRVYWVSCECCGLIELKGWVEPVQRKAEEVINSQ